MIPTILPSSGLGDSIYIQPIVGELLKKYESVIVRTNFPEIFSVFPNVTTEPYTKCKPYDYDIRYIDYKPRQSTTQYQDMCLQAELYTPYRLISPKLTDSTSTTRIVLNNLRKTGYIVYRIPSTPMCSKQSIDLMPDITKYLEIIERIQEETQLPLVAVGLSKDALIDNYPYDFDLVDRTSISELFHLIENALHVITFPCNLVPLADGYPNVKLHLILSVVGLMSDNEFISTITYNKIVEHKYKSTEYIV